MEKKSRKWTLRMAGEEDTKTSGHAKSFVLDLEWPKKGGEEEVKVEWEFQEVNL